jgi:hypothetical protein
MKSMIAIMTVCCVIGVSLADHHFAAPIAGIPVALPYAASLPQSRFSRTDWIQPGQAIAIPAVAKYQSITPGFTTLHSSAIPVVAQAPLIAAPLDAHWRR